MLTSLSTRLSRVIIVQLSRNFNAANTRQVTPILISVAPSKRVNVIFHITMYTLGM